MNEVIPEETPELLVKKPLLRHHLWTMSAHDVIYQLDCTSYPQLKLADLLVLPVWETIKKHGIS